MIVVPLAVLALTVILIGIPLAALLLVADIVALFVCHAAAGLALGQRVFSRVGSRYAQIALGVATITIVTHLPYIGWLLRLAIVAVGLGGVVLALWLRQTPSVPAPTPAAA
jgi:hypothetical protein